MPAKKNRSPIQRESQLAAVAAGYLRGMGLQQIADQLGVYRTQITYDLNILRKRWQASSERDFNQKLAEELARIDQVEQEYWAAWERSKQPRERTLSEQRQSTVASTRAQVTRQQRDGTAFFLEGVERCIDRRIRLLGLDAAAARQDNVIDLQMVLAAARARIAAGDA